MRSTLGPEENLVSLQVRHRNQINQNEFGRVLIIEPQNAAYKDRLAYVDVIHPCSALPQSRSLYKKKSPRVRSPGHRDYFDISEPAKPDTTPCTTTPDVLRSTPSGLMTCNFSRIDTRYRSMQRKYLVILMALLQIYIMIGQRLARAAPLLLSGQVSHMSDPIMTSYL